MLQNRKEVPTANILLTAIKICTIKKKIFCQSPHLSLLHFGCTIQSHINVSMVVQETL